MNFSFKTDIGKKRAENQDTVIAGILPNGIFYGFVCDGMGGANGGKYASRTLCDFLTGYLNLQGTKKLEDEDVFVVNAIEDACSNIYLTSQKKPELKGMGTTISGLTVNGNRCLVYNVGDSRTYILRNDELRQVTTDHSIVQQMFDEGLITRDKMNQHPQKHIITRAIGVENNAEVDVYEVELKNGDKLLCCSDGLSNFVEENDIKAILSYHDVTAICDLLVEKALANQASDNISCIVLDF